jgi:DJ-1/PfpI family
MLKTLDTISRLRYPTGLLFCALFVLGAKLASTKGKRRVAPYKGPAGGWGSAEAVAKALIRNRVPLRGARLLLHQNKSQGFACVSCAWAKPKSRALEFCENGAKATAWEIDAHRARPDFFANHTISELLTWSDAQLERQGRLTHPLRWDKTSDKYVPVQWEEAFRDIGHRLRACDPKSVVKEKGNTDWRSARPVSMITMVCYFQAGLRISTNCAPMPRRLALSRFFDSGEPVAAICHGPWMRVEADVVRERTLTSWPSLKTDIRNAGGLGRSRGRPVRTVDSSRKPDDIPASFARWWVHSERGR